VFGHETIGETVSISLGQKATSGGKSGSVAAWMSARLQGGVGPEAGHWMAYPAERTVSKARAPVIKAKSPSFAAYWPRQAGVVKYGRRLRAA